MLKNIDLQNDKNGFVVQKIIFSRWLIPPPCLGEINMMVPYFKRKHYGTIMEYLWNHKCFVA